METDLDAFFEGFRDALPQGERDVWEHHFALYRLKEGLSDIELIDLTTAGYQSGLWEGTAYTKNNLT